MDYEEYFSNTWELISYEDISEDFYKEYQDKFQNFTFDLFRIYEMSEYVSPNSAAMIIRSFARELKRR